jgi:hypothetical protein
MVLEKPWRTPHVGKSPRCRTRPGAALAYSVPGGSDDETHKNHAAVAWALQHMQLAAFEADLVSVWSNTARFPRDPALKTSPGAEADWELVAALYFGHPAPGGTSTREPGLADFTRWVRD